jgi:lipopolysaccharide export system protein LptA
MTLGRQTRKRGRQRRIVLAAASLPVALLFSMPHALAQTPVSGFSGLGGENSKKPIDIYSDSVEVDDKTHIGVFIGNVSATQGDYNLKAPRIEVYYEGGPQNQPGAKTAHASKPVTPVKAPAPGESGEASALTKCLTRSTPPAQARNAQASKPVKPVKAASASDSSDSLSSGQIKCIHATGGKVVVVSKKDQQQADGEDAVYDVSDQKVFMTGKKVVLTQKGNVIEGNKLTIDLATGQATVDNQGRIRAVFTQEKGKDGKTVNPFAEGQKKGGAAAQKDATPKAAAPAPGWQTQSH